MCSDKPVDIVLNTSNSDKVKNLIITKKGRLKWCSDLITLQLVHEEVWNIKSKWTTASGAKVLKKTQQHYAGIAKIRRLQLIV